jgi:hypothetical protein
MILSAVLFLSPMSLPVLGKDLNVLVRVLYAAFFVEQGAAMCSVPSVQLSDDDRVLFVNTKNYAQWIKQKVTVDLPPEEVSIILKSAADRAKGELTEVIKILKSYPADREYAELSAWCTTRMTSFARNIVVGYVEEREKIDGIIENAKRD